MKFDPLEKQLKEESQHFKPSFKISFSKRVMEEIQRQEIQPVPDQTQPNFFFKVAALILISLGLGASFFWDWDSTTIQYEAVASQDVVREELQLLKDDLQGLVNLDRQLLASYFSLDQETPPLED